jgi:hypothetical protein
VFNTDTAAGQINPYARRPAMVRNPDERMNGRASRRRLRTAENQVECRRRIGNHRL